MTWRSVTRADRGIRKPSFADATTDWILRRLPGLGIENAVRHSLTSDGKNVLSIDHLMPADERGARVRFHVTTDHRELIAPHFPDVSVRREINSASLERGRAVFIDDLWREETMAAIAYHVDDAGPLHIRAMALRQDPGEPRAWAESRHALVICKAVLHIFGEKAGRGSDLLYDADTKAKVEEAKRYLGFRRARRGALRPSGRELLCQPKLGR